MLFFQESEYGTRLRRLQEDLRSKDVPVFLSFGPENICYMTGHQSPGYYMYQVAIIPAQGEPILLVRQGEMGNARAYSWLDRKDIHFYDDTNDPVACTVALLHRLGFGSGRVGMEMDGWFLSPKRFSAIQEAFGARLVDCSKTVEALRAIKSEQEIAYIRKACYAVDRSMEAAYDILAPGVNENDLARVILAALIDNGSEYLGLDPFVASGPRAAIMHSPWSGRTIEDNEVVLLEVAGCIHRYHGALMRTVYVGDPGPLAFEWAEICRQALDAAVAAIRPGVTSAQVDEACRGVIEREGLYEFFRKRTGYSIGLAFAPDWGEGHFLGLQKGDPTVLKPGMTFHMPPALREYGKLGVGISETVLVTDTGCEVLGRFPREFVGKP
ncbi:MAG: Xaa-Pro peptidase family protein [Bacillota bacterium]|nr:Xaa-Pro peptidase family protein [Bacillota bacterium]